MSIFQRLVLLIKVLLMLSIGMSSAWAHNPVQASKAGFSTVQNGQGSGLQLAKSESDPPAEGNNSAGDNDDDDPDDKPDSGDDNDADQDGDSDT
jgi:hypothetical protein